jgi:hypothetical protein
MSKKLKQKQQNQSFLIRKIVFCIAAFLFALGTTLNYINNFADISNESFSECMKYIIPICFTISLSGIIVQSKKIKN